MRKRQSILILVAATAGAVLMGIRPSNGGTITYNSIAEANSEPTQPIIIGNDTLIIKEDGGGTVTANIDSQGRSINPVLKVDRNTAGDGDADAWTFTGYQLSLAENSSFTARKGANITSGTPTVTITKAPYSSESNNGREYLYTTDGVDLRLNGHSSGSDRRRIYVFAGNTHGNEVYGRIRQDTSSTKSVVKRGAGTWTLSASGNTYQGPTKVEQGTLRVNGSTHASSTVTVNAGGTLGGTGTINGAVSVLSGGIIAPGVLTGTLTVNNNVTIAGSLAIEVDDTQNPKADKLVVANALDITGATLDCTVTGIASEKAYVIASYGSLTGTFTENLPRGMSVDYTYLGGKEIAIIPPAVGTVLVIR